MLIYFDNMTMLYPLQEISAAMIVSAVEHQHLGYSAVIRNRLRAMFAVDKMLPNIMDAYMILIKKESLITHRSCMPVIMDNV